MAEALGAAQSSRQRLLSYHLRWPVSLTAGIFARQARFKTPAADIVDLYSHRWEIELGYREMKQSLLGNRLTLRSRTPEMVFQELWSTLLAYNLIRFHMARMACRAPEPVQLPPGLPLDHQGAVLPWVSPGRVPGVIQSMLEMAPAFVLPERRERSYPRSVRPRPKKYPTKRKASQR